jgi:hypothetical protein
MRRELGALKSSEGDSSSPVGSKQSFHLQISADSCYLTRIFGHHVVGPNGLTIADDHIQVSSNQNCISHELQKPTHLPLNLVSFLLRNAFHAPVDQSAQMTKTG